MGVLLVQGMVAPQVHRTASAMVVGPSHHIAQSLASNSLCVSLVVTSLFLSLSLSASIVSLTQVIRSQEDIVSAVHRTQVAAQYTTQPGAQLITLTLRPNHLTPLTPTHSLIAVAHNPKRSQDLHHHHHNHHHSSPSSNHVQVRSDEDCAQLDDTLSGSQQGSATSAGSYHCGEGSFEYVSPSPPPRSPCRIS